MLRRTVRKFLRLFAAEPSASFAEPHEWIATAERASKAGNTEAVLFLSFDCDTDLDIPAAKTLAYELRAKNVASTFAVPGEQLLRGQDTFRAMAEDGFEFMNHGALPHAYWDGEKYIPVTFYDQLTKDEIIADIREGDRIVKEVTGKAPKGFRAPHFGCFQAPEQIDLMHEVCADLGYTYASTTIPKIGMERGPFFHNKGILELPLAGSWREPYNIPDSWSNLSDRVTFTLSSRFTELWRESLEAVQKDDLPIFLCWYVDPAHVLGQAAFDEAVALLCRSGIQTLSGTECAERLDSLLTAAPR